MGMAGIEPAMFLLWEIYSLLPSPLGIHTHIIRLCFYLLHAGINFLLEYSYHKIIITNCSQTDLNGHLQVRSQSVYPLAYENETTGLRLELRNRTNRYGCLANSCLTN